MFLKLVTVTGQTIRINVDSVHTYRNSKQLVDGGGLRCGAVIIHRNVEALDIEVRETVPQIDRMLTRAGRLLSLTETV